MKNAMKNMYKYKFTIFWGFTLVLLLYNSLFLGVAFSFNVLRLQDPIAGGLVGMGGLLTVYLTAFFFYNITTKEDMDCKSDRMIIFVYSIYAGIIVTCAIMLINPSAILILFWLLGRAFIPSL